MKLRKKPVVVDGEQWFKHGDNPSVHETVWSHSGGKDCRECGLPLEEHGVIDTLEGHHIVCPGDWIITGIKGEKYPCKPDIKEATYEEIRDES